MVKRLLLALLISGALAAAQYHGFHVWWRQLVTSSDTSNAGTYATATFPMATNHTYLVAVQTSDTASLVHTHSLSSGHTGVTWTQINTVLFNTVAAPTERISLWKGSCTTSSSGTLTNTVSDNATGCNMVVWELTGTAQVSSLIIQSNTATGSGADPSITLGSTVDQGRRDLVVMVIGTGSNGSAVAPNIAWNAVEDADIGYNTPASGLAVYGAARTEKTTAKVTRTASEWGALAVEVRHVQASAPVDTPVASTRVTEAGDTRTTEEGDTRVIEL